MNFADTLKEKNLSDWRVEYSTYADIILWNIKRIVVPRTTKHKSFLKHVKVIEGKNNNG